MYDFKNSFLILLSIALCDIDISPDELMFLYEIGIQNGISENEVDAILHSPHKTKIEFPTKREDIMDLLFNSSKMILADKKILDEEVMVLKRVIANVGFLEAKIDEITSLLIEFAKSNKPKNELVNLLTNYL